MWNRIVSFALGKGPRGAPPERVRWLIVEQQLRGKILIGWVGFALSKKYGTYLPASESTVRAAGEGVSFRPVDEITVRGRAAPARVYTL